MDERHWWIASRLSQAFGIDPASSFLEKFICQPDNIEKINNFLCMNGNNKLFFYSYKNENAAAPLVSAKFNEIFIVDNLLKLPRELFVANMIDSQRGTNETQMSVNMLNTSLTSNNTAVPNKGIDNLVILYFLRHDTLQEVSQTQIYKEVYCGEIKNCSQIIYNIYNDLLLTLFETNKNWGNCTETNKTQSIKNMVKYVNGINELAIDNQSYKNLMLKRVEPDALTELKQLRLSSDAPIIKYCEDLALEWIATIENVLSDICDEKFIHQSVGPSSELERWQRKQRLLGNLTEQLKSKECKSVISALIAAKSKVLKKWKAIDTGITDAQNECRDKVKFLESLKRPIDQFYHDATPLTCISVALPNLCTAMRTIESVSRYYARQGYLGLLFTKVTNQLVNICKEYLSEIAVSVNGEEYFWPTILKEVDEHNSLLINSSDVTNLTHVLQASQQDLLFNRLRACLIVQAKYRETFRTLRDALGGNQALSNFPSISSSIQNSERSFSHKDSLVAANARPQLTNAHKKSLSENTFLNSRNNAGILMSEEDIIFGHIDTFCNRLKCVIEQMVTLAQFQALLRLSNGIIRPKKDDLKLKEFEKKFGLTPDDYDDDDDDDDEKDDAKESEDESKFRTAVKKVMKRETAAESDATGVENNVSDQATNKAILEILVEENEENSFLNRSMKKSNGEKSWQNKSNGNKVEEELLSDLDIHDDNISEPLEEEKDEQNDSGVISEGDKKEAPVKTAAGNLFKMEENVENDSKNLLTKAQILSKEDIKLMKKYYGKNDDGPTVSFVIENYLNTMKNVLTSIKLSHILDVETKDSNTFDQFHQKFLYAQTSLEKFLIAYLNIIFIKTKKTNDGLNILMRFKSVSQRTALRPIINDKYVELFSNYEKDLTDTESAFEEFKNNPPLLRNAPPIGGAITWVRQLFQKIDEPMKMFRENKYISNLADFNSTHKYYSKIVANLNDYERAYLHHWKGSIEEARNGFKGYLLKKNEKNYTFEINMDDRLLVLFQEAKWLSRMNIELPASVKELLGLEKKYKGYKSNLEMLLSDYEKTIRTIPPHFLNLYEPHIKQTLDLCNQGCCILTWNSLNIDSFLKMVENGINKLRNLVEFVTHTKEAKIYSLIMEISRMDLFDQQLAYSQHWLPDQFIKMIGKSTEEKGALVAQKLAQIETEINEIGGLLIINKDETTTSSSTNSRNSVGTNTTKKALKAAQAKSQIESHPKLAQLRVHYSDALYEAIKTSILNSLNNLAKSCGYQLDFYKLADAIFRNNSSAENFTNDTEELDVVSRSGMTTEANSRLNNDESSELLVNNEAGLKYVRLKSVDDLKYRNYDLNAKRIRPISVESVISKATWSAERKLENAFLKLEFILKYTIPDIITEPALNLCQNSVKMIANRIIEVSKAISWFHPKTKKNFHDTIVNDGHVLVSFNVFNTLLEEVGPVIREHMMHFKLFEFLWKEDLNHMFDEFMKFDPGEAAVKREVERLSKIEAQISEIPQYLNVGPVCLNTDTIKISLKSFAYAWKSKYSSVLHEMARGRLEDAIYYRENIRNRLNTNVKTLEQLNDALKLLEELSDMENKIDKIYLPIENIYNDLKRFNLILTRQEIEQVNNLRENWSKLMENAENVRRLLLQENRNSLEQELDKQVKTFVVEVIRFRNNFDAQGPSVAGINPYEAIRRLIDFQKQYDSFNARRKTLDSISILFGLHCKPFPELDKTGEELKLLNQLYGVYKLYLDFDKSFRNSLWIECDLGQASTSIKDYWQKFLDLPEKLKENWNAYWDLKKALKKYIDVLPILLLLNKKEIRNRHWLQVMQVTKSTFRLESNIFRLNDLVDIGLELHASEIEEICIAAQKEQELETKMRQIEEEWNEQVLSFTFYKDYGEILFDRPYTERLLEQLEDAQETLALMLTSKYVGPLRAEVASWSEKLKIIGDVLELWLDVQELWVKIETVFTNNPATLKEMPAEAKRFSRVDKSWIRSQKQSFDMKSVLQCCLGSSTQENTKRVLLKDIQKELEICFKSLNTYLDKKRRSFPRYYLLSNSALLGLLSNSSSAATFNVKPIVHQIQGKMSNTTTSSNVTGMTATTSTATAATVPNTLSSQSSSAMNGYYTLTPTIQIYLNSLFSSVHTVKLDEVKEKESINSEKQNELAQSFRAQSHHYGSFSLATDVLSFLRNKDQQNHLMNQEFEISQVSSADGELLVLQKKVSLEKSADLWLPKLKESISETLKRSLNMALNDLINSSMQVEEMAIKYPAQICFVGLTYLWTRDAETAIIEAKNERKAVYFNSKKFGQYAAKFQAIIYKSKWTTSDKPLTNVHKKRLESMLIFASYLRDSYENLASKRIKDQSDFEWQKCFRVYLQDDNVHNLVPKFHVFNESYSYGSEFYGAEQFAVITPITERCYLSIWQASRLAKGACLIGKSGMGKTQTAKGIAQYLGKFIAVLNCTSQTDQSSISNFLQGLAQEGAWGLFDEVRNLSKLCSAWFNEYASGIYQAIRKRSAQTMLADGKEINVNFNFNLILTANPFTGPNELSSEGQRLSQDLRSLFRNVAILEPDLETIFRVKCLQYGLKSPNILGSRLKTLYDICNDGSFIISASNNSALNSKYKLTVNNFLAIIRMVAEETLRNLTIAFTHTADGGSRPASFAGNLNNPSAGISKYGGAAKAEVLTNQLIPAKDLPKKNRGAQVNYSKNDHAIFGQAVIDIMSPRFDLNDSKLFKKVVQEIFGFKEDSKIVVQSNQANANAANLLNLERIISAKAFNDYGLFPNKNWIEKCLQIYTISNTFKSVVLCGHTGTGKTTTLNVLVDSLSELSNESKNTNDNLNSSSGANEGVFKQSSIVNAHKLRRINQMAIDDESLLFGTLSQNGDFKDGLLTNMLKKACRNLSTTWLCLDGPIFSCWSDNFNAIFDSGFSHLQLKNGDRIRINSTRLIFETGDISSASPSFLSKTGILFYGDDLVGWRSIARSWLEKRVKTEIQCLQKCFSKTMDDVCTYVFKDCKPMLPVREESLFLSCLNLLDSMLTENTNIGGEIHIERLFLYCLIWTFGGVLEKSDQRGFSDLLYRLVSALPDDDLKSSVFEYYLDESGEWDLWSQRVPENVFMDNMDLLGNVFVDTIDTIRCRIFLEFSNLSNQNVILFGPRGSGKTKLIQEFIDDFDTNLTIAKRLNFSGATRATQIQKFIEANIVHRQGFTYGTFDKKKFTVFIDDLNLPKTDSNGVQRCNELIRQIVDGKFIYSYTKPFEIKKLEQINFYCTLSPQNGSSYSIDPRLLRHSILLYLPTPDELAYRSIFAGTLEASMLYNDKANIDSDLQASIVDASIGLLELLTGVLRACPTPGREHYLFNMKSIIVILQGLRKLGETQRTDTLSVISLWRHEIFRTIGDQLPRHSDYYWLESTVSSLIKEKFSTHINPATQKLIENFVDFRMEARNYDRPMSAYQNRQVKVQLSPVESLETVRTFIEQLYIRYKEEYGYHQINLAISENITSHIIRIHRILAFTESGNILLIGTIGNHLSSLIKLSLYLAEIQLHQVDCSKSSLFYDSIRSAIRSAGSENKTVSLIFTSKELETEEYLDTISSLLNNGECLHLFSNDEMDGLYQAIGPSIKREYPSMIIDPKKFFNTRVKKNLHICICLSPNSDIYSNKIIKTYKNILGSCQIYWIKDWSEEAIMNEAKFFITNKFRSNETAPEGEKDETKASQNELNKKLINCMSEIHMYMLNESKQIPWAGLTDREISVPNQKALEKKANTTTAGSTTTTTTTQGAAAAPGAGSNANPTSALNTSLNNSFMNSSLGPKSTMTTVNIPNWPYSKTILNELIKLEHIPKSEKSKLDFFIGPNTFLRFMNSFFYFFTTKAKQCENDIIRLRRVLDTLGTTRDGTKAMKNYIKELKQRCKQAEIDSELALKNLIEKTTMVEKLKAKFGLNGQLAALMRQQHEEKSGSDEEEDEDSQTEGGKSKSVLLNEEPDDYDKEFIKMKDDCQKTRQARMMEELEKIRHLYEECKKNLSEKRKQVEYWRNKVDRACVEHVKGFQNPPYLVGQIMEMISVMIGKRKLTEITNKPEGVTVVSGKDVGQSAKEKEKEKEKEEPTGGKPGKRTSNKMERLDRNQWRVYQNMMQDSGKFVDLLHSIEWEDGLQSDVAQAVEGYLAKGKDGQLGITGEGSLLTENQKDINIPAAKGDNSSGKGITISAARYASEDTATLVHYVIAVLEYTKLCVPMKAAKDKMNNIKFEQVEYERKKQETEAERKKLKELAEMLAQDPGIQEDENVGEQDLPKLLKELQELQNIFDLAAVKKYRLHKELEGCKQRLEAASTIISRDQNEIQEAFEGTDIKILQPRFQSITSLEDQWKKWIEEHLSHEQTITNCLITAAFISYCGPFNTDIRKKICQFLINCCIKHEIPEEPQKIFKNLSLSEFLFSPIQLKEIQLLRLPCTENLLENGCFIIEDKSYDNWPLLCDSSRRSIDWIRTLYKDKQLFILRQHEMKSVLETCLSEGYILLIIDCDVKNLMRNKRIETILRNKTRFINSDKPFKLNLGNQEIECNPKFRLFLHTISEPTSIPDDLASYTVVINYTLNRYDIEEELLDKFLLLAKPRIDSERYGLLQEKVNTLKIIDPLEQDITNFLASDVNLLSSVEPTKRLSDLKKLYDEAVDSNTRIELAEEPLIKTRESYREIAQRASICYNVITCLREINSNYIMSFKEFETLFEESIYQFERSSPPQVIEKLTQSVYAYMTRMMNEADKKVYSILLSIEIEAAADRVKVGEREYLISPAYGAMFMQSLTGKQFTEHKFWTAKRPFDWMLDEQYLNLQYLAISFSWFSDQFERMAKDGRETQWRTLCESETPETVPLPDKLDDTLAPIQRLCVVRALRSDRVLNASLGFVSTVLGKNFTNLNSIDLESAFVQSNAQKPILLIYAEEPESVRRYFLRFAKSKENQPCVINDINALGLAEDKQIKRLMSRPMEDGTWVLLHNCHNSINILNQIESIIQECSNQKKLNSNFRCWISLLKSEIDDKPISIMFNSIRVFIDSPLTMKENMTRSLNWVELEQFKSVNNKQEWPILLHNLCYYHSCLKLRNRFARCGWNAPLTLNFTTEEFLESFKVALNEYSMNDTPHSRSESLKSNTDRSMSVQAIKYIVSDLIYGCSASNEYDLQAIQFIAEYWISSITNKRDFEVAKLKYKIPGAFFNSQPKLPSLQQSFENISLMQLESPEACHLLPSIETILGDDIFIMTKLNKLIDNLEITQNNVKIYDRPFTPIDNAVLPTVNGNSNNPFLTSNINDTVSMTSGNGSKQYQSLFSSACIMASQNRKYNELNDYCTSILNSKLPKTFTKDQINDKVKKNGGGPSPFNNWIVNEMNQITNLINSIRSHLTTIKNATDQKKLGCDWDDELIEIADSLYHYQIPKKWCFLSGSKVAFGSFYSLGSFLNDVSTRFQHIDKCLTMGREKSPGYNLSAFYCPQGLLSLLKFEFIKNKGQSDDVGFVESVVFQSEMTSRDREHLRDPPKEGVFIYGLYLWGCHWEKSSSELVDQAVKSKEGYLSLPVIHLTCWLESDKPFLNDSQKASDLYKCPVYMNKMQKDLVILNLDMYHLNVASQKWAMRGVCATLKPY